MATEKKLKVVITADDKNLQKTLQKSEKALSNFNKRTLGESKVATKEFAAGMDGGSAALGKISTGAAAAGVAIAAMAAAVARSAILANKEWTTFSRQLSSMTTQSSTILSTFTGGMKGMAVDYRTALMALGAVSEKLNIDLTKLTDKEAAYWTAQSGKIAKLAEDSNSDVAQLGASFSEVEQRWAKDGKAFDYTARVIYTAAKKAFASPVQMADMIKEASPTFQRLGYTLEETAGIMSRFAEKGLDSSSFLSVAKRNIDEFGSNSKLARKEMDGLVADVKRLEKEGDFGGIDKLLASYGLSSGQAETFRQSVSMGVFNGGALQGNSLYVLPDPDVKSWKDLGQKISNNIKLGLSGLADYFFKLVYPLEKVDNITTWDLPKEPGRITTETIVPTVPPEKMPITTETVPLGFTGPSPLATTAFGGVAYDFKDPLVQMTMDSQQATLKLEGNADVVEAKWRDGLANIARSADYNMASIKVVAGDAAQRVGGELARQFYTLHTIFGDIGLDITDMQAKLNEWGINVPTLFDNILAGAERIGWELVENLGLPYTKEEVTTFIQDMDALFKQYGVNLGEFWKDCTDGVKTSTEEIGKQAVGNLKLLAGDLIMTMSDMFATGEWDWKKLWKKTWQGLLAIAVDYVLKIIANEQFMLAAWAAIQQVIEGLKGNWLKVAAIAAGVAAGAGIIAGIVAKVKQNNEEGAGESSLYGGTPPPSVSPYPTTSSTSSTVIIQNPTFIGEIDDRSALAGGEGLAKAQSIRGAGTLAFA